MIEISRKARDKVTGFEGVVSAHCRYLTGCDQYLVQPPMKDGSYIEARWFDVHRLEDLGPGVTVEIPEAKRHVGGPQDTPTPRPVPAQGVAR